MISGLVLQFVDFGSEITNVAVPAAAVGVGAITGVAAIGLGHKRGYTSCTVMSSIFLGLMFVAVLVSIFSSQLFGAGFNATWMNVFIGAGVAVGGVIFLTGTIVNANKTYQVETAEPLRKALNDKRKAHNIMRHIVNNMTGEKEVSNEKEEVARVTEDLKNFTESEQDVIMKAAEKIGRERLQEIVKTDAHEIFMDKCKQTDLFATPKEIEGLKCEAEEQAIVNHSLKVQADRSLKHNSKKDKENTLTNDDKPDDAKKWKETYVMGQTTWTDGDGNYKTEKPARKATKNVRRRLVAPLHRLMEQINATA